MARPARWRELDIVNGVLVTELASWKYFHDYIRQEFLDLPNFVWRGQRDAAWSLRSSLDRLLTRYSARTKQRVKSLNQLEKTIKAQRAQLLQAHGVLTCLYEVLLHADGEQAVPYAQAAYVAASLINKSAEELDSVRIWPLIEALASASDRVEEPRDLYVD